MEKDRIIKHTDIEKAYKIADKLSEWAIKAAESGRVNKDIDELLVMSLDVAKALEVRHNDLASIESKIRDAQDKYDRVVSRYKDVQKRNSELVIEINRIKGMVFEDSKKEEVKINLNESL